MYTAAEVERLRLLHRAVARGHSIGRLAALTDEELRVLMVAVERSSVSAGYPTPGTTLDSAALLAAVRSFDAAGIADEAGRLAARLRPLDLLQEVVMPLLAHAGEGCHRRRTSRAQEHAVSFALRTKIGRAHV